MAKSRIFLYFCVFFVAGILADSLFFISLPARLGILISGIFLISVFWRSKKAVLAGFCLVFLVFGIWRHSLAESEIVPPPEGRLTFKGTVCKEPDIRPDKLQLVLETEKVKGKVLVVTDRYPEYEYGNELEVSGSLRVPVELPDFNYRDYLAKDGIYSVSYYPEIELLKERDKGIEIFLYGKLLDFKEKLRESLYSNFSPPQSSVLGAMVLGDKRRMPDELKEKLNLAGVRHITAVSGLHVAVLAGLLMAFFSKLRLGGKAAFYSTVSALAFFVLMTGAHPSAVRAGIMGGLFLWARYLGRSAASSRAVVLAASLMLLFNPLLLELDVGFQLSFLAVMGIIYFFSFFKKLVRSDILALTLSAQVFTLPVLIYNFGYFSLVAPLSNILIVPLLPFVLGLGFLSGLAGILWDFLGRIFSWPAWLLLSYLTEVVDFFSGIPLASLTFENVHWVFLPVSYSLLGFLAWKLRSKQKLKNMVEWNNER